MFRASVLARAGAVVALSASPTFAIVIGFTGGTDYFGGGGSGVTNNSASYADSDYYEEAGYRFDFIGDPSSQYVGNYYGAGNDSIHAHTLNGFNFVEVRVSRIDGQAFNLDSFLVTSNTQQGGGPATGNELSFVNASYNGATVGFSQLLPSEDWGRATDTPVLFGPQFDNILYFSLTADPTTYCLGIDDVNVNLVPAPSTLALLGLGVGAAARRCRRRV